MSVRPEPRANCERWRVDIIVRPAGEPPLPRIRLLTLNEADAHPVHARLQRGERWRQTEGHIELFAVHGTQLDAYPHFV